jgi:hypothetical protein
MTREAKIKYPSSILKTPTSAKQLARKLEKLRREVLPSSTLTTGTNTRMSSREML